MQHDSQTYSVAACDPECPKSRRYNAEQHQNKGVAQASSFFASVKASQLQSCDVAGVLMEPPAGCMGALWCLLNIPCSHVKWQRQQALVRDSHADGRSRPEDTGLFECDVQCTQSRDAAVVPVVKRINDMLPTLADLQAELAGHDISTTACWAADTAVLDLALTRGSTRRLQWSTKCLSRDGRHDTDRSIGLMHALAAHLVSKSTERAT
jgi:hypothetical protein